MVKKVLLINTNDVIGGSVVEANVDTKLLSKAISIAQETGLKPILGNNLYNEVTDAVYENSLNSVPLAAKYVNLLDAVKPYMIAKTVADFITINAYKFTNKGLMKMNDNSATSLDDASLKGLKDYYNNLVTTYKIDILDYLKNNNLVAGGTDKDITSNGIGWFLESDYTPISYSSEQPAINDTYVTGATYNENTGVATFTNNVGGSFHVTINGTGGSGGGASISGFTYNPNENALTIIDFTGGTFSVSIESLSGLTVANAVSASTYYGDGSNLTGIHDYYTTGGTFNDTTGVATFTNNTGGAFNVTGFQSKINGTGFVKASGTSISYDNSNYLAASSADAKFLQFSGGTLTGDLLLYNATPNNALSAVPKNYVDNLLNGLSWKYSVRASTVSALPAYTVSGGNTILTGNANGALSLDAVSLSVNDRVLVKNEGVSDRANNGIYTVTQIGDGSNPYILTRATDANTSTKLEAATVNVRQGAIEANRVYAVNVSPVVLGTTQITFSLVSGAGTYTNGTGLNLTANVFSIDSSVVTLTGSQTLTNKSIAVSQLTGNGALTKTDDTNVTLTLGGTPSTALINATSLTLGWNGQLSSTRGGSGINNAGSFSWGSNNITFNTTGTTNLTLPVSGTVATTTTVSPFVSQTDGATITINCNNQAITNATVTLGGNRTLAFSNFVDGAYLTLVVTQDSTGNRTLTLPASTKVVGNSGGAVVLTTTSGSTDVLSFFKNGSTVFCSYGQNFN